MTDELIQLGPVVCRADSVEVESSDSTVQLTVAGISVQGPDPVDEPWTGVVSLAIVGPALPRRWDLVLKVWDLLSPVVGLRSGKTEIRVDTLARSLSVEVEPGPGAPYAYADLDAVEAIIATVGEAGAWSLLGDPTWLMPVMRQARSARSWLTPLTQRRVRHIVRAALS